MSTIHFDVKHSETAPGTVAPKRDYRLKTEPLYTRLAFEAPPRVQDLLAISAAVYTVDRLVRRNYQSALRGPMRVLDVTVPVSDPRFWGTVKRSRLLSDILYAISGDQWTIRFDKSEPRQYQGSLLPRHGTVCLYSGGLDSAAGLCTRLADGLEDVVAVTMLHVGRQRGRVERQLKRLNEHFGSKVFPVLVPMALFKPPKLSQQELSQRCRGFIFASLGLAAAVGCGASEIEIYENGVGALNVPLMSGMSVAGRATKGCHPRFLSLFSDLACDVLDREVRVTLPFLSHTKGDLVRSLATAGLHDVVFDSFSCIHTSPRVKGEPRQCGLCPACLGRRQAIAAAGIQEPSDAYVIDFLNETSVNGLPDGELAYLKATLMQVAHFAEERDTLTDRVRHYLHSSGATSASLPVARCTEVLLRYRDEWMAIAERARGTGLRWTTWM